MMLLFSSVNAQLVDGVLGQKRTVVQVLLRPFRIIDYKKERVVRFIEEGIHQTVLYENDTCVNFYWAVDSAAIPSFKTQLANAGYTATADGFVKDSLALSIKPLASGKSTLFIAAITGGLVGDRDASGNLVVVRTKRMVENEPMPLLQQAILAEEKNKFAEKKPKDPKRHWVGEKEGSMKVLGWEH
ncbi:MAG: hypothetical protein K9G46_06820 [Flavobacteriales bacterium]|jgi:hypothetical protein|nr:hypothetical protein [Flavobacteriales bacterium]